MPQSNKNNFYLDKKIMSYIKMEKNMKECKNSVEKQKKEK